MRRPALGPKHAEAKFCESLVRLRLGQFVEGWRDYEWRWRQLSWGERARFAAPLWLGAEPLAGKTILLHAEQGFGDTLQFVRYVPLVAGLGAGPAQVQPPLKSLLSGIAGAAYVVARGEALPAFDLHCPLMSLPLAFATEVGSIPAAFPIPGASRSPSRMAGAAGRRRGLRVGFALGGEPSAQATIALGRVRPTSAALSVPGVAP